MKRTKIKTLKNKAWKVFSVWVRQRGMDKWGYNKCVTCGVREHWKNLNAGHFYHGHYSCSFMDERNVWPQCVRCNRHLHGNLIEYSEFLRGLYGNEIVDILRELKHQIWKPTEEELEGIIKKYGHES